MKTRFNMVEIVISLVVIMIGLIGVLGLVPHSMEMSHDAIARTNAATATDSFLHYMAVRIETNWDESNAIPDVKSADDDREAVWSELLKPNDGETVSKKLFFPSDKLKISFNAANELYEWDTEDPEANATGVFRVEQLTDSGGTDFIGVLRVWKEMVEINPKEGSEKGKKMTEAQKQKIIDKLEKGGKTVVAHAPGGDVSKCVTLVVSQNAWDNGHGHHANDKNDFCDADLYGLRGMVCVLNAEISWPADAPYENRQKVVYQIEVAQPGLSLGADGDAAADVDDASGVPPAEIPPPEDPVAEEDLFDIEDGQIVLNEAQNAEIEALGCGMSVQYHGTTYEWGITASIFIDGDEETPFGDPSSPATGNLNDGAGHVFDAGLLEAGTTIAIVASSFWPEGYFGHDIDDLHWTVSSNPANSAVLVLQDGDSVPDISGFEDQRDVAEFVGDYVDTASNTVTLEPNQAILLFELYTTDSDNDACDYQDVVMLITLTD